VNALILASLRTFRNLNDAHSLTGPRTIHSATDLPALPGSFFARAPSIASTRGLHFIWQPGKKVCNHAPRQRQSLMRLLDGGRIRLAGVTKPNRVLVERRRLPRESGEFILHRSAQGPQFLQIVDLGKRPIVPGEKSLACLFHRLLSVEESVPNKRRGSRQIMFGVSQILVGSRKPVCASLRRRSSGCIQQLPFSNHRGGKRCAQGQAPVKIAGPVNEHVHSGSRAHQCLICRPLVQPSRRRIIGNHDHDIVIAIRSGIATGSRTEKVNPLRLIGAPAGQPLPPVWDRRRMEPFELLVAYLLLP